MTGEATLFRKAAEPLAALLPPLLVDAERVAATVQAGVHGRRRVGPGDSFWQYRRYQDGDPVSQIDWRQSAKRQAYFIRQNEWEAAESVYLWCDTSASMRWRSNPSLPEKRERGAILLLALASLLLRGGERVALAGMGPPASGRAVIERIAISLTADSVDAATSLPREQQMARYAQFVLFGDFLSPFAEIEQRFHMFAAQGVRGHVLHVFDPAELALPFQGRTRFLGLEGEADYLASRVETLRDDWRAHLQKREARLRDLVRGLGWTYARHETDHPPQTALLALYMALAGDNIGRGGR